MYEFRYQTLTLLWRRSLSYRNQSIDLKCKSMDWFLYDRDFRHERVKGLVLNMEISNQSLIFQIQLVDCLIETSPRSVLSASIGELLDSKKFLRFYFLTERFFATVAWYFQSIRKTRKYEFTVVKIRSITNLKIKSISYPILIKAATINLYQKFFWRQQLIINLTLPNTS